MDWLAPVQTREAMVALPVRNSKSNGARRRNDEILKRLAQSSQNVHKRP